MDLNLSMKLMQQNYSRILIHLDFSTVLRRSLQTRTKITECRKVICRQLISGPEAVYKKR